MGTDGVYTHTVAYDKDPSCLVCSAGLPVEVPASATLQEVWVPVLPSLMPSGQRGLSRPVLLHFCGMPQPCAEA